jgi:hypothetical protein
MARRKCRDCDRCTESTAKGCLVAPVRFWIDFFRKLFVFPFVEMCPDCRHPIRWHRRDERGRFAD